MENNQKMSYDKGDREREVCVEGRVAGWQRQCEENMN